jgi:hypothetical protein
VITDHDDRDVVAQLSAWADHLAAQVPVSTAEATTTSAMIARRHIAWGVAVASIAAAVLFGVVLLRPHRSIAPAPPVDSAGSTSEPPTTTSLSASNLVSLGGTQWSVQHGAAVLILELQRLKDGNGIVVGQIGNDGIEGGCTAVDGTVRVDGSTIVFSSLRADTACNGAPEFLAALTEARTFSRSGDSRISLFDGAGRELLSLDGYDATTFAPIIRESDRLGPPAPLVGLWRLDFTDSGLSSAVFIGENPQRPYQILVSLDVGEFRPGRLMLGAGVAGGCFEASAPYTVDADVITVGIFDAAANQCGPEVLRLIQRLVGQQRFTIQGQVLDVAGFHFLRTRPADRSTAPPASTLPFAATTVPLAGTWNLNSDASGFGPTGLDQAPTTTPPIDAALTIAAIQPDSASTAFALRLAGGRVADCSLGTTTMTVTPSAVDASRGTVKVEPFVDSSSTSSTCGAEIGVVRERLVGATDFDIRGRVLTIYDAQGRASLVFVEP